jgi:UDP-2,3-diacylglucosamine pyrophosphatase LpxH
MEIAHAEDGPARLRSVFISDFHLGTPGARADLLLEFLDQLECEQLYLVGDVIDGWRLRKSWYWTPEFDAVLRAIFAQARRGARVTFIPGNHDEMFREWIGLEIAGITLAAEAVHVGADGRASW